MSQVRVEVDSRAVMAELRRLAMRAEDLSPAMGAIGLELSQKAGATFGDQADPYGNAWTPLSPVTIALRQRKRKAGGEKILRDTGALANSITHEAGRRDVEVGTNLAYAAAQQFGNPANKIYGKASAPIPARQFLPTDGLPGDWQQDVLAVLAAHLEPRA